MIVYPAIDIRGGRCVQLVQGDFDREMQFYADPADAARRWVAAGAEWLHVVDLDGARSGGPVNLPALARIREAVEIPIELGGGLRSAEHVASALELGIDRAILGSVALSSPDLVRAAVDRWGERIAVGLDARDGKLAANGWLDQTDALAVDIARSLAEAGVQHFIFTDIRQDGTLTGPNLDALQTMIAATPAGVIASGGVGSIDDVRAIAETGAAGVIIGTALYAGRVDLAQAIDVAREVEQVA